MNIKQHRLSSGEENVKIGGGQKPTITGEKEEKNGNICKGKQDNAPMMEEGHMEGREAKEVGELVYERDEAGAAKVRRGHSKQGRRKTIHTQA